MLDNGERVKRVPHNDTILIDELVVLTPHKVVNLHLNQTKSIVLFYRNNNASIVLLYRNIFNILSHLFERDREIHYWKNGGECDFIIKVGIEVKRAIQVCSHLSSRTEEREWDGLLDALEEFELEKGTIVTSEKEGEENIKGKKIRYMPLWRFLLKD